MESSHENLAIACLLFLETAKDSLSDEKYNILQNFLCQNLPNHVIEATLHKKLMGKKIKKITIKHIYSFYSSNGVAFIKALRELTKISLNEAYNKWKLVNSGNEVSFELPIAFENNQKTKDNLLKLANTCYFTIE